jgi:hypothetical protein
MTVERVGDAAHARAGLYLEGLRRDLDRALDDLNQSGCGPELGSLIITRLR